MSISLHELVQYADTLLKAHEFNDYCPNGLQVEASCEVIKIIAGVTASKALIDVAIKEKADVLVVHHGYFWKGEKPELTGIKGQRIRALMQSGISLLAYHLPLDAHVELGNNVQLAKVLGWEITGGMDKSPHPIGLVGNVPSPMLLAHMADDIGQKLQRTTQYFGESDRTISRIAWCTGAAQSYMEKAISLGVDCFITGEVSEQTYHLAQESGVAFIAAGHHATERYGVKALGEHLTKAFSLDVQFVDIDNPV